jgi:hypothetical protein
MRTAYHIGYNIESVILKRKLWVHIEVLHNILCQNLLSQENNQFPQKKKQSRSVAEKITVGASAQKEQQVARGVNSTKSQF